jgi:hypothetical protein
MGCPPRAGMPMSFVEAGEEAKGALTPVSEESPPGGFRCSTEDAGGDVHGDDGAWDVDIELDLTGLGPEAEDSTVPEKATRRQAAAAKRRGDKPSTQAGAFVREEMEHKATRKHGRMSRKQAIAIGLSKAREAGIRIRAKPRAKR